MTEPPPPPPPEEAELARDRCPNCGAPHEPYQEYCLECGHRLPRTYTVRRETRWSRDSPAWLWAALVALFLVALAGTVLALVLTHDDNKGTAVVSVKPTTTPIGTQFTGATSTTLPGTLTIGPATGSTSLSIATFTSTTATTTPTTTAATSGTISWPSGRSGYTIVLESDPVAQGRSKPNAAAQRALDAGLPQVGILNSSKYSSLNPGYYVVFTGVYGSQSRAASHLATARSAGFPLAYVRQVSP